MAQAEFNEHQSVLLSESVAALNIQPDGFYVDATFGRGGHSREILAVLSSNGRLLGLDRDAQAIAFGREAFRDEPRLHLVQAPFAELAEQVNDLGWSGKVMGVLADLGVSSPQLDDGQRGFSFRRDGPLDMRMDSSSGVSAAQWLAKAKAAEIERVLKEYGEERFARRIAQAIVREREVAPISTTARLAKIVADANPRWEKDKDPATRAFQAIRIEINQELQQLQQLLAQVLTVLAPGGRLAVISFHSLEDRMVKRFMRDQARGDDFPAGLPVTQAQLNPRMRLVGKAIRPGEREQAENPRARSAVLRVAEKL